jgi:hypothetical protein
MHQRAEIPTLPLFLVLLPELIDGVDVACDAASRPAQSWWMPQSSLMASLLEERRVALVVRRRQVLLSFANP